MQYVNSTKGSSSVASGRVSGWLDGLARRVNKTSTVKGEHLPVSPGETAPDFTLIDLDGTRLTLASLLHRDKPLVLVFVSPTCTACHEALRDIGDWQENYAGRLDIAVITTGSLETNRQLANESGLETMFIQRDRELMERYGLSMSPAAVVVLPDGEISMEPQYGRDAILQLVAATLDVEIDTVSGTVGKPVGRGDMPPRIDATDINGTLISLDNYLGAPVLLMFWDPGCGFCHQLLNRIRAFEHATTRVPLVVVSMGPVALNQALGLSSPVVIDDDRTIAGAYGVSTTPAALLIGSRGLVASAVAVGAQAVGAYIDRCHVPVITPVEPIGLCATGNGINTIDLDRDALQATASSIPTQEVS